MDNIVTPQLNIDTSIHALERFNGALDLLIEHLLDEYAEETVIEQDLDAASLSANAVNPEVPKGEQVLYSSSCDDL
jgi:hypothetical protein